MASHCAMLRTWIAHALRCQPGLSCWNHLHPADRLLRCRTGIISGLGLLQPCKQTLEVVQTWSLPPAWHLVQAHARQKHPVALSGLSLGCRSDCCCPSATSNTHRQGFAFVLRINALEHGRVLEHVRHNHEADATTAPTGKHTQLGMQLGVVYHMPVSALNSGGSSPSVRGDGSAPA